MRVVFKQALCYCNQQQEIDGSLCGGTQGSPPGAGCCPHHGLILCAACGKHPTPFKGPAEDVREEGRQNPEPEPFQMLHPMHSVL